MATVRFYYSFRSPYAWIATERIEAELADLDVGLELHPIFPIPGQFPNDPASLPAKVRYLLQDVPRVARAHGLKVRFPNHVDTDWALPHAAAVVADELGHGLPFALEMFRQRWVQGADIGEPEVVGEAARLAGLDADTIVTRAQDDALQQQVADAWTRVREEDGVFGVPTFALGDALFWGQDRIAALRAAIAEGGSV